MIILCLLVFSGFVITEKETDGTVMSSYDCETQDDIDNAMLEALTTRNIYRDDVLYRAASLSDKEKIALLESKLAAVESKVTTLETAKVSA